MSPWLFFFLTLVLEYPVILFFYKKQWKEVTVPFLLLNLFTWPLLHFLLLTTDFTLAVMELGVALVELVGYKLLLNSSWLKSFMASFVANGISYGVGILINNYFL